MATKCPNCELKFRAKEALCVDWKDPEKSFGCPHCEKFFIRDMNSKKEQPIIAALVASGIMMPAFNLLIRAIDAGDRNTTVQASIIIVSVIACGLVLLWDSMPFTKPLVTSPFQYGKDNRDDSDTS